ncbi:hypothetical protein QAD02_006694 [Eretmocerus hayati]|uniref:Uncharacterized protein n=1 Tax=Eretmocerus hayati TaxID=131215 RepID=A0ACC2N1Y3_9HYME|nr:hypothetical protein QAD02_006694 [Eretmocerus hayati]
MPRLIGKRLCIDGFMYSKEKTGANGQNVWKCVRSRETGDRKCDAKAITSDPSSDDELIVLLGPTVSSHNHCPSVAEIEDAEELMRLRKKREKAKSTIVERIKKKKGKKWGMALMNNPDLYRKFLLEFLKNPVFDRKHLIGALKDIYSSETGRWASYATILENREKVEKDIEALRNDPRASVSNKESNERPHEESSDSPVEKQNKDQLLQTLTNFTDKISKLTEEISQLKERRSHRKKIKVKIIPPVPPAVPITEALPDPPPKPLNTDTDIPIIDLSDDELEVKKEIDIVDLTEDDTEIKQEYNPPSEPTWQQDLRRVSPDHHYENGRYYQNNHYAPPTVIQGVPCPPTIDQRLLHVPEDSEYNRPQYVSNIQVPLHNFIPPSERRQLSGIEPMYAEIRFYHRPVAIQEISHTSS